MAFRHYERSEACHRVALRADPLGPRNDGDVHRAEFSSAVAISAPGTSNHPPVRAGPPVRASTLRGDGEQQQAEIEHGVFSFDTGAPIEDKPRMPKKPGTNPKGEFAFFNVVYEDDSVRSNRRVPSEILGGLDGDEPARGFIMEQDREISEKSGRPPLAIKSISRVGAKKK